jgi:hypothetical protein
MLAYKAGRFGNRFGNQTLPKRLYRQGAVGLARDDTADRLHACPPKLAWSRELIAIATGAESGAHGVPDVMTNSYKSVLITSKESSHRLTVSDGVL